MSKRVFSAIIMSLLVLGTLTLVRIQPVKAGMITVPDDYPTIQAAINNANNGDTIYVRNGTYDEGLVIGKDSLTLLGESHDAFINGTLSIKADNVTVKGFNITDAVVDVFTGPGIPEELTQPIIELSSCHNTTIIGNTVEGFIVVFPKLAEEWIGGVGCELLDGSNNVVRNNMFQYCESSIWVGNESNDFIVGNDLNTAGDFELYLGSTQNTTIYHNNFHITVKGAAQTGSNATWDIGYPSGGNYWSNYNGTDSFSGAYQNTTGSDGIGDTPLVIDAYYNIVDHYPLVKPWTAHIAGDLNGDGTVDLKDLVLMACTYGSTPTCTNWDENADLDGNGRISLTDMVTLATHYGQHYP
jgi:hypothetical protein